MATRDPKKLVRINPTLAAQIAAEAALNGVPSYQLLERAVRLFLEKNFPNIRPPSNPTKKKPGPPRAREKLTGPPSRGKHQHH